MKVCRFNDHRVGVVQGSVIIDVTAKMRRLAAQADDGPRGDPLVWVLPELRGMSPGELEACPSIPLNAARLLSPVAAPTKILAAPDNYKAHAREMEADPAASFGRRVLPLAEAGLFLKAISSLVGPSEGIPVRFLDRRTDFEVELVAVIGTTGSNIPADAARRHVAGYAIGLDITVRGPEDRSFRKSLDGYSVVGPWLTTADEIADVGDLPLSLRQNGIVRQQSSTSDLISEVALLIEYASSFSTLWPGDMIFTGTPAGVGPIRPGDVLQAEIARLGTMSVAVRAADG
jgi:2-keto-4-pentenoate hydratase/2-oxohepta-3-ene-1,7-dioic acid hydratase in catechol pathway